MISGQSDVQQPPEGCGVRDGVEHYTRVIAADPQSRRDAVLALMGWLVRTENLAETGQAGMGGIYWVWATLEDVADLYDDESAFDGAAQRAASEWLALSPPVAESQETWVAEWTAWLEEYAATHTTRLTDPSEKVPISHACTAVRYPAVSDAEPSGGPLLRHPLLTAGTVGSVVTLAFVVVLIAGEADLDLPQMFVFGGIFGFGAFIVALFVLWLVETFTRPRS